ncbi:MAG: hypothetical protein MI923_02815, partial [Phycisphaerales bacterium]|nr:hypothetical protein [Phycisphaerales bacterium]
ENLQTALSDTQGASARSSKNSKASMYALQTAHTHLEKSYFKVKKERDELWEKRNELKRTISALQGDLSSDDLRLQIEELRENYEGLRVRLNMGAEAYRVKFIEWHQLEAKLSKLIWSSSEEFVEQLLESGPVLEMQSVVAKLWKAFQG